MGSMDFVRGLLTKRRRKGGRLKPSFYSAIEIFTYPFPLLNPCV